MSTNNNLHGAYNSDYGGTGRLREQLDENLAFVSTYLISKLPPLFGATIIGRPFIENGGVAIDFTAKDYDRHAAHDYAKKLDATFPKPGHDFAVTTEFSEGRIKVRLAMDPARARQYIRNYDRAYAESQNAQQGRGA